MQPNFSGYQQLTQQYGGANPVYPQVPNYAMPPQQTPIIPQDFNAYKQQNGYVAPQFNGQRPSPQPFDFGNNSTMAYVYGLEGAKAYPVGAGNTVTLFDNENNDIFYKKSADANGKITLFEVYRSTKIDESEIQHKPAEKNQNGDALSKILERLDSMESELDELKTRKYYPKKSQPQRNEVNSNEQ